MAGQGLEFELQISASDRIRDVRHRRPKVKNGGLHTRRLFATRIQGVEKGEFQREIERAIRGESGDRIYLIVVARNTDSDPVVNLFTAWLHVAETTRFK